MMTSSPALPLPLLPAEVLDSLHASTGRVTELATSLNRQAAEGLLPNLDVMRANQLVTHSLQHP
jgi:hypothetical protein